MLAPVLVIGLVLVLVLMLVVVLVLARVGHGHGRQHGRDAVNEDGRSHESPKTSAGTGTFWF
ncbi:MAG: hypothetical protein ACJ784_22030 [Myxococcales bacterium]